MSKIEVLSSAQMGDGCENNLGKQSEHDRDYSAAGLVELQDKIGHIGNRGLRPDVLAGEALDASMHAISGSRATPLAPVQSPRDSMTGFKRGLASCHLIDRIWPFDRILPCRDTPSRKNVDGFEAQPVE